MRVDSWTKLAVVVLVSIAASVLGFYGRIDSQAVVALLSAALGYVFGNSHGIVTAMNQKQLNGNGGESSEIK